MSIRDFAARGARPDLEAATYTLVLSDALFVGVQALPRVLVELVKDSVYGVALLSNLESAVLSPTILVSERLARGVSKTVNAMGIPGIADVLTRLIGAETQWLSRIRVMGVAPLEEHLGPGDIVFAARPGTVGSAVKWSNNFGFLTAGHVAAINSTPVCNGVTVGTVVYSNNPVGHGLRIEDDVALIQLSSASSFNRTTAGMGQAGPGDQVSIQSANVTNAQIQGYSTFFHSQNSNATYGELYLTHGQVTQPGDSGAAVLDSSGDLLGHVIGGSPGAFSYIQDIHYQLRIIDSQPGFSGITLW